MNYIKNSFPVIITSAIVFIISYLAIQLTILSASIFSIGVFIFLTLYYKDFGLRLLLAYPMIIPFGYVILNHPNTTLIKLLFFASFVVIMLHGLIKNYYFKLKSNKYFYLFFMIIILLGASRTQNFSYALEKVLGLSYIVIIALIMDNLHTKLDLIKTYQSAIFFMGLILLGFSFLEIFHLEQYFNPYFYGRFSTMNINPIWIGRYFSYFIITLVFFLFETEQLLNKLILIILMIFGVYFVLLSGSRGPLLGLMLSASYISLRKVELKKILIFVGFVLILIAMSYNLIPQNLLDRILNKDSSSMASSAIRVLLQINAFNLFLTNKLLGIGLANFTFENSLISNDVFIYPHNLFMEILSEMGILGISFLFLLLGKTFGDLKYLKSKLTNNKYDFLVCIFLMTFINTNLSGHIGKNPYFWISISVINIIAFYKREDENSLYYIS